MEKQKDGKDLNSSKEDISGGKTLVVDKRGKKRSSTGTVEDVEGEVQNILKDFGVDINKVLLVKRKRIEMYTKASFQTNNQKIEYVWKTPQKQMQNLNQEYSQQFTALFQQWDADLQGAEKREEKLASMFRQQQKLFQQARIAQNQRLKTIRQLYEHFTKSLKDLEKNHENLLDAANGEFKKEMAILQKTFMIESQQEEMASIRKSLQSMLL